MERMLDGIELAMEIIASPQLATVLEPEGRRRWEWSDRETLADMVRRSSQTTNHCSGTARMGPAGDPLAVVDATGRVYGAQNLVVADSSVFPTCPRGNIHFPVVAVAEKLAAGLG
jgi:choline dehydrogenase